MKSEIGILQALADGLTTKEMAERMNRLEVTVETTRTRLYGKIGAKNAPNAVAWAFRNGYVE